MPRQAASSRHLPRSTWRLNMSSLLRRNPPWLLRVGATRSPDLSTRRTTACVVSQNVGENLRVTDFAAVAHAGPPATDFAPVAHAGPPATDFAPAAHAGALTQRAAGGKSQELRAARTVRHGAEADS
jgi:hypothetical protein